LIIMKTETHKGLYPALKQQATLGYSCEAIVKQLDTVTNSYLDKPGLKTVGGLLEIRSASRRCRCCRMQQSNSSSRLFAYRDH
jgi:hypothetical protein